MNKITAKMLTLGACLFLATSVWGQLTPAGGGAADVLTTKYLSLRAVPEYMRVTSGQSFHVALDVNIARGWVWYSPDPVGPAAPASLKVEAPGLIVGDILWPTDAAKSTDFGDKIVDIYAYKHRAVVYVKLTVPANAAPGEKTITLLPEGQICGTSCIDIQPFGYAKPFAAVAKGTVAAKSAANPQWSDDPAISGGLAEAKTVEQLKAGRPADSRAKPAPKPAGAYLGSWAAIGVALLAGLLLNIMPCVLPVIPIRILSIVEMAGGSRRRFVTMGLAFTGGMMLFFAAIAAVNIVLKLGFFGGAGTLDLGQHLQNPTVLIVLSALLIALAANLFGVFNVIVPGRVAGLETGVQSRKSGHLKSFSLGFMMAVLATPCSFGFLVAAMGYAQIAPLVRGAVVILAIGAGMSAPHALLSAFPSLVDRLPRPGRWMEIFKQGCGFVLLIVAIWLLAGLRGESYKDAWPFWIIAWGVMLTVGLWMWAGWVRYDAPIRRKLIVRGAAVALVVVSGIYMLPAPQPPLLQAGQFSPAAVAEARNDGKVVLVKFTGKLCSKCAMQDVTVFNTPEAAKAIRSRDVAYFKADVAKGSPGYQWLVRHKGTTAIPLTLIFPPKGEPVELRDELTTELLIRRLDEAAGKK